MSDFYCSECQIVWAGDHCRNCSPPIEADDQRITSRHDNPDAVVHVEDPIVRLLTAQIQDANKQIAELERQLKVLMHSAAHPPAIEEEPAGFPANALRFSA